jgi:enoyl-CoA hydratase/carnithine racemase
VPYKTILVDRTKGVGTITLNRPQVLNAINLQLVEEMKAAVDDLEGDDDIRCLILTGSGERAFSAGADIHEMRTFTPQEHEAVQEMRYQAQWRIATCKKPIIGAINGLCYGGGTILATSLDFLVGCERSKFRFLATAYGQINATWTLHNLVGWPVAKELLYTGRVVEPQEARDLGLLNHLVPADKLMDKARELASLIVANYPASVQGTKSLMLQNLGRSWGEMRQAEHEARNSGYQGLPIEEGFQEFIQRKGRGP